ncbi:MAG: bifunctional hydroxymethylpyrimidine kinase/phosphomethylpyrimidine kinase [Candidatus Sumerlaeia bacterium]|nr:bifunctional hydroxymethylpyrimidine kinase/phosphomethylpyrimidine kinase [Candidatus Sumerlaeia bacterium]
MSQKTEPQTRHGLLSITSRVANGWVGNSLIEMACGILAPRHPFFALDTVQWTAPGNHPRREGPVLDAHDLKGMISALLAPGSDDFSIRHVLTGYLRTPEQVEALVHTLHKGPHHLDTIIVDPVAGDNGRLYVSPDTAAALRDKLVPMAAYILPNLTEAAFLAQMEGVDDAARIATVLLDRYPNLRGVAITSAPGDQHPDQIGAHVATRDGAEWTGGKCLPGHHHGTGDFFSGVVLALVGSGGCDFSTACATATRLVREAVSLHEGDDALTPRQMYRHVLANHLGDRAPSRL